MKIKLIQKANPQKREDVKWYASPINVGTKDLKAIAKDIAGRSSLTRGDIENVLANFVDELPTFLKDGFSIQLGDFGTMRLTLSSEGSLTEEEFSTHGIKPRVTFTAGQDIKHDLETIHYERIHQDPPSPTPPPAE